MKIVIDIPSVRDAEAVIKHITAAGGVDWDMGYDGPTAFVLSAHAAVDASSQPGRPKDTTVHSPECVKAHFKRGHTFITHESALCNCKPGVNNR